jgi:Tol biopolymer transport system component
MGSRYGVTAIVYRAWHWVGLAILIGALTAGCGLLPFGKAAEPRPVVPSRVAYSAEDGHVYTVPLGGGDSHRISQVVGNSPDATVGREAQVPRWPTWSPDASRIAFTRVLVGAGETLVASQLWTAAHDGTDLRKIWDAPDKEPIYLAWSPDGSLIALLVQTEEDLELEIVDATGAQPVRRVAQGNPFYFCWAPDSRSLLLHIGSTGSGASKPELALARLGPPDEVRSLGVPPGDFRTPGWTSDGRKVAFVATGPDGVQTISMVSPEGGDITRLATSSKQAAFMLALDGNRLAWGSKSEQDRLAYDGLEVVTTDGRTHTRVTGDLVVAWFWSPDGRQLAFVTLERSGQSFVWQVADADGSNVRRLSSFMPTPGEIRIMAFFDQYAISHGPWAPDSTALVYAVGLPGELPGAGLSGPGVIQSVAVDGKSQPKTVIGGNFVAMPVPAP